MIHSRHANEFPRPYGRRCGHLSSSSFLVFGESSSRMSHAVTLAVQLTQLNSTQQVQLKTSASCLLSNFRLSWQKSGITLIVYIYEGTLSGT